MTDLRQSEPEDQALSCEEPTQIKSVWRSLSETGENSLSILDVKTIIENLSAALGQKHWNLINAELERLDISKMGEDAMVAVTRTLAPASKMLPYWKCFIGKLNSSITERSLDLNVLRDLV